MDGFHCLLQAVEKEVPTPQPEPTAPTQVASSKTKPRQKVPRAKGTKRRRAEVKETTSSRASVENPDADKDLDKDDREKKRKLRRMRNRLSAKNSREKKKRYISELELLVADLKEQNDRLRSDNEALVCRVVSACTCSCECKGKTPSAASTPVRGSLKTPSSALNDLATISLTPTLAPISPAVTAESSRSANSESEGSVDFTLSPRVTSARSLRQPTACISNTDVAAAIVEFSAGAKRVQKRLNMRGLPASSILRPSNHRIK